MPFGLPGHVPIAIPATAATTSSIPLGMGQLKIPRRQYSDDRFDTVSNTATKATATASTTTKVAESTIDAQFAQSEPLSSTGTLAVVLPEHVASAQWR
ncbi:hypothetical protein BGX29_007925 [Mortierella sp. GBA35]|nr:hypothetical protein BGX29_007925 [Mortierella sp. GBA35]